MRYLIVSLIIVFLAGCGSAAPRLEPTRVPYPTFTPTVSPVAQYLSEIRPSLIDLASAMKQTALLLQAPNPLDNQWRLDISMHMGSVRADHELIQQIAPPGEAADLHREIIDAVAICNEFTEKLADGIDDFDADRLRDAKSLMDKCAADLSAVVSKLPR